MRELLEGTCFGQYSQEMNATSLFLSAHLRARLLMTKRALDGLITYCTCYLRVGGSNGERWIAWLLGCLVDCLIA